MKTKKDLFNFREVNLSYIPSKDIIKRPLIDTSTKAFEYLSQSYNDQSIGLKEEFNVLLLNRANKPLGIYKMSAGGMDSTIVDVRLLMVTALKSLASGLILSHNHPSGKLKASESDIQTTKNIKKACTIMNITLLDHLILDPFGGYMSFADEGLL